MVEHNFFLLENSPLLGVFLLRPGLQANHGIVRKSAMFPQPSIQKQLKWSNAAYVNKCVFTVKIELCVFRRGNQDLTLYKGDSNFQRATGKNTPF